MKRIIQSLPSLLFAILFIFNQASTSSEHRHRQKNNEITEIPAQPCVLSSADSAMIAETYTAAHAPKEPAPTPEEETVKSLFGQIDFNLFLVNSSRGSVNVRYLSNAGNFNDYSVNNIRWDCQQTLVVGDGQMNLLVEQIRTNPDAVLTVIEKNSALFKNILILSGFAEKARALYGKVNYWAKGENPKISRQFEKFFTTYGDLEDFPYESDPGLSQKEKNFSTDMKAIMVADREFFTEPWNGYVPRSYLEWLFYHRWKQRLGDFFQKIMNAVGKIVS